MATLASAEYRGNIYNRKYDEERAKKKRVKLGIIGVGGVAHTKHIPAIMRLVAMWEPPDLVADVNERIAEKVGRPFV